MSAKSKKIVKPKFDWEAFYMLGGIGIVSTAIGALIFWASYTAPANNPELLSANTMQRLVRMLPNDTTNKIASIIAILFMLFGLFLICAMVYRTIRFLLFKR